jgi:hypothetical protein
MLSGIYFLKSLDCLCSLERGLFLLLGLSGLWGVVAKCSSFFIFLQSYYGVESLLSPCNWHNDMWVICLWALQ